MTRRIWIALYGLAELWQFIGEDFRIEPNAGCEDGVKPLIYRRLDSA